MGPAQGQSGPPQHGHSPTHAPSLKFVLFQDSHFGQIYDSQACLHVGTTWKTGKPTDAWILLLVIFMWRVGLEWGLGILVLGLSV